MQRSCQQVRGWCEKCVCARVWGGQVANQSDTPRPWQVLRPYNASPLPCRQLAAPAPELLLLAPLQCLPDPGYPRWLLFYSGWLSSPPCTPLQLHLPRPAAPPLAAARPHRLLSAALASRAAACSLQLSSHPLPPDSYSPPAPAARSPRPPAPPPHCHSLPTAAACPLPPLLPAATPPTASSM